MERVEGENRLRGSVKVKRGGEWSDRVCICGRCKGGWSGVSCGRLS